MSTVLNITASPLAEPNLDIGFKKIIILLLLIGLVMIFVGYYQIKDLTNYPQVIYKYIPKSYYDEMFIQAPITSVFGKMFNNSSPWHSAKPGHDHHEPVYTYNHFTKKGAYNFYDNQDLYYDY